MRVTRRPTCFVAKLAAVAVVLAASPAAQEPLVHFVEQPFGAVPPMEDMAPGVLVFGDVNADGIPDFVLSDAEADTPQGPDSGRIVVVSGADRSVLWTADGASSGENFGRSVAAAGDVDADGVRDLLVGAPHGPPPVEGYARVFSGDDGAVLLTLDLDPGQDSEHFGEYVAGDANFDGDVHADMVVLKVNGLIDGEASVNLFRGSDGALLASYPAIFFFGSAFLATLGDVNSDGTDDFCYRWTGEAGGTLLVRAGDDGELLQELAVSSAADVGDRDGDGVPDLFLSDARVVSGDTWETLLVVPGTISPGGPGGLGDLDGDDVPELAWGRGVHSGVDGALLFAAADAVGLQELGDVDGDGATDLIGGNLALLPEQMHSPAALLLRRPATLRLETAGPEPGAVLGRQVAVLGDTNLDGHADLLVSAPGVDGIGLDVGELRVVSGADGATLLALTGFAGEEFGSVAAPAGDVDGDGVPDIVVGLPSAVVGPVAVGSVRVYSGDDGGLIFTAFGSAAGGRFGAAVAAAGDVDLDGFGDVVVGAPWEPTLATKRGGVWLLTGPDGAVRFHLVNATINHALGSAVASMDDLDGDGLRDLLAGGPGTTAGNPGRVLLLSGDDGASFGAVFGLASERNLGGSLASLGDVNGDGAPDFAAGARWHQASDTDYEQVVVVSGFNTTRLHTWTLPRGPTAGVPAIGLAGDVDGDGGPDVAIGARGLDGVGLVEARSAATGATLLTLAGPAGDEAGAAVGGGDVNGDGRDDLVVGIPGDDEAGADAGRVRVLGLEAVVPPWSFLGHGLVGSQGLPVLLGAGSLVPGQSVTLTLDDALPFAHSALVLGLRAANLPFHGGTLVPAPDVVLWPIVIGWSGGWQFTAHWPAGLPAGTSVWLQSWIKDLGAAGGFSASNALLGVTP